MKLKLGDFLRRRKDAVDVTDGVKYKRATIRINHKGISIRDEKDGTQIKTKRQFSISKGQFLLSKIDARNGAFGIVPDELDKGIITGNFWTFDVDQSKVLIAFFKAFTESATFTDICIRSSSGTTNRKYLDEKKFLEIEIEVPDIEKQTVVISNYHQKKEAIKKLQDFGVNQREILSNLRQSILQEAVQGKLTEKWRANNPNTEPASELLKRIEAEKQQLIAEKKIKTSHKLHSKAKKEPSFKVPESWECRRFWDVVWCYRGHNPPKSDFIQEPREGYVRFIQITDFKTDSRAVYVPESHKLKRVQRGEILMAAYRHIGKLSRRMEGAFNVALCKVNCIEPFNIDFLELLIGTPVVKGELLAESERGHIPSMHSDHLLSLWVPVPPLEEQKAIVEKVNSLMALCDELELQIETSQTQIEQLMQSCLKEVFEH